MPKFAAFASGKTPTNSSHEIFSNSFVGSHYSHLVYSFVYKNNKLFPLSTNCCKFKLEMYIASFATVAQKKHSDHMFEKYHKF